MSSLRAETISWRRDTAEEPHSQWKVIGPNNDPNAGWIGQLLTPKGSAENLQHFWGYEPGR